MRGVTQWEEVNVVNDTAISKYVRSAENDFRWIDAGLEAGLLDLDIIEGRAEFGVNYPGEDDKRRVHNGIRSHRAARNEDGSKRKASTVWTPHRHVSMI